MKTSDTLGAAWRAIEKEAGLPGLYERRVFAASALSLSVGITHPEGLLRLTLTAPAAATVAGLARETRGYRVHLQYVPSGRLVQIHLELLGKPYQELYEVVAADVVDNMLQAHGDAAAVAALKARLDHWQRFMVAAGTGGLSQERQVGLFGELTFLSGLLRSGMDPNDALRTWAGPSGDNQDFRLAARAVEVKATTTNSPTRVHIANELQLDSSNLESLALLHLWLEARSGPGPSLPALVHSLRDALPTAAADTLGALLLQAGYHEVHRPLYEGTAYLERHRRYYAIGHGFPRIVHTDLRSGVAEVSYVVDLSGCGPNLQSEESAISTFRSLT